MGSSVQGSSVQGSTVKRLLVLGLVGVCSMTAVPVSAGSEAMKAVVAAYLDIQAQLAGDMIEGIKAKAHAIREQASQMGEPGAPVAAAAAELEKAADLKAAREAFGALSDVVIAAAKADGWRDVKDLKLGYCPMARRSWLQAQTTVQNPYYGKAMLTCGELKTVQ
jgi:hypothetical protein